MVATTTMMFIVRLKIEQEITDPTTIRQTTIGQQLAMDMRVVVFQCHHLVETMERMVQTMAAPTMIFRQLM